MSLATDLLEQAEHLATRDPNRPKQASLRRAISTAYYSLFHLLIEHGAARIVSSSSLRSNVARAFNHQDVKKAASAIVTGQNRRLVSLFEGEIEQELKNVCSTFTELQKQRNQADYDAGRLPYQRAEAMGYVSRAASAHSDWEKVCNSHNALVFLLAGAKLLPNRE